MDRAIYHIEFAVVEKYCEKNGMDEMECYALLRMMCRILNEK